MPYYDLLIVKEQRTLATAAKDRDDALAIFGQEIGLRLTLAGQGAAPFLLDEWHEGPHWVHPTIPVFTVPN